LEAPLNLDAKALHSISGPKPQDSTIRDRWCLVDIRYFPKSLHNTQYASPLHPFSPENPTMNLHILPKHRSPLRWAVAQLTFVTLHRRIDRSWTDSS